MTSCFIILERPHKPLPSVYKMDPILCLYWKFPWYYVCSVCQARDEKKLPPKMRNTFVAASFYSAILPMVSCLFRQKWEAGMWNKGIFRIIFCVLSISYIYIILESKIPRVFPTQIYHVVFQLVIFLSLDVTVVLLMWMDKLVCSNIVIETRKRPGSNTDSNQVSIMDKYGIFSVIASNIEK